jgi:hypothetical protein
VLEPLGGAPQCGGSVRSGAHHNAHTMSFNGLALPLVVSPKGRTCCEGHSNKLLGSTFEMTDVLEPPDGGSAIGDGGRQSGAHHCPWVENICGHLHASCVEICA